MGLLQAMGYTRVREYHGGIQEWTDAGLAVGKAQGLAKGAADPQRARRPAVQVHSRIGRVLHRLAGSSYATLVGLWFGVVACAASFYWLASLAGPSLMTSSGAPVSPTLRGLVTSLYFSASSRRLRSDLVTSSPWAHRASWRSPRR